jgi:hypothetical protein
MNILEEAKTAKKLQQYTKKSVPIIVNSSNVELMNNVIEAYKNSNSKILAGKEPNVEMLKKLFGKLFGERVREYYERIPAHPDMGMPEDWTVEKVKVGYYSNYWVYAGIILNKESNERWFIYFDAKKNAKQNIDPHYSKIETKFFDIDKFPMEVVVNAPQEAKGKAVELTAKQFEDTMKASKVGKLTSRL